MRILTTKEHSYYMARFMGRRCEVAYATLGIAGLQAEIEFPSDWHEEARAWVRLGLGFGKLCFSFPWKWTVPDDYQCSGPTYGFHFHSDGLWIHYGKSHGKRGDPTLSINMPWAWKHRKHEVLTKPEVYPYTYTLRSGEVQQRTATIQVETRLWTRYWLPWRMFKKSINIEFSDEVGERSGSWKGGCIGCSYDMLPNETPLDTLRRMELERKF